MFNKKHYLRFEFEYDTKEDVVRNLVFISFMFLAGTALILSGGLLSDHEKMMTEVLGGCFYFVFFLMATFVLVRRYYTITYNEGITKFVMCVTPVIYTLCIIGITLFTIIGANRPRELIVVFIVTFIVDCVFGFHILSKKLSKVIVNKLNSDSIDKKEE